jgi:hypothetical protein
MSLGMVFLRMVPLERSSFSKFLIIHLVDAVVASGLWVLAARILASELSGWSTFHNLSVLLPKDYPLLFTCGVFLYLLAVAFY